MSALRPFSSALLLKRTRAPLAQPGKLVRHYVFLPGAAVAHLGQLQVPSEMVKAHYTKATR